MVKKLFRNVLLLIGLALPVMAVQVDTLVYGTGLPTGDKKRKGTVFTCDGAQTERKLLQVTNQGGVLATLYVKHTGSNVSEFKKMTVTVDGNDPRVLFDSSDSSDLYCPTGYNNNQNVCPYNLYIPYNTSMTVNGTCYQGSSAGKHWVDYYKY